MTKRIGFFLSVMTLLATAASATPVTFSTSGVFTCAACAGSGTTSVTFTGDNGQTTLNFTGAGSTNVNTDVGSQFGDILASSTVPSMQAGPALTGSLTLNFHQTAPTVGTQSLVGSLSGTLGLNQGIATLSFGGTTSVVIGGITYTVNPSYTISCPTCGSGGSSPIGTTTLQGTVTGGGAVPDSGSTLMLLGSAFLGLGALRRRFNI